jgi:ATP-dependent DNA helicase 2 subunit 1
MKKRTLGRVRMRVVEGELELGVKVFTLLRDAEKSKYVWIDPQTLHPVKPRTKWVCQDTGQLLRTAQIKKFQAYGDAKVVFEDAEVKKLKAIYPAGITVLGFKDRDCLKDYHNLEHSNFLFPDEAAVKVRELGCVIILYANLDSI